MISAREKEEQKKSCEDTRLKLERGHRKVFVAGVYLGARHSVLLYIVTVLLGAIANPAPKRKHVLRIALFIEPL